MAPPKRPDALARLKYARHKAQSKFRRIGFHLTYEEWLQWWHDHGVDKNQDQKWAGGQRPCMCRYGDQGDYQLDNIYFAMDNENVRDANLNGRMSYSRRYIQKNYRWGDKLISLEELRQQEKFEQRNLKFYRRDYYDHYRQWESDKLTKQWLALPKNKLRYWGDTQGCWHRSVPEAAKASGLDKLAYQHRLDKGKVKRRVEYLISLNDYILSKTRFPDPIVPNQDQITKKKG